MKEAPKKIYLQVDPEGDAAPDVDVFDTNEVTWCQDQINDNDVAYIRVDLVESMIRDTLG